MAKTDTATFAGGCFWCTEAIFQRLKGVKSVMSGYTGGKVDNPSYEAVSTGATNHAEAIQITFDPDMIAYEQLLLVFFKTHDPTTLNRQGADEGTQYRSAVFYHNEEQKKAIDKVIAKIEQEKIYSNKIVTQVLPFDSFYEAEKYHQDYYAKNKDAMYCQVVIDPKLEKLEKEFSELLAS